MMQLLGLICIIVAMSVHTLKAQNVGVGTDNPIEFFSVGANSQFRVNASGDIVRINNVQYSFPASNSTGTLVNNGSGTLIWSNAPSLSVSNFTGTLPALNAANLTNVNAANLSGTLPALNASNLTNLNASNLASGTVPTARLGSGTADATTFLRGDGTWAAPAGGGGGGSSTISTFSLNAVSLTNSSFSDISSDISIPSGKNIVVVNILAPLAAPNIRFELYSPSTSMVHAGGTIAGVTTGGGEFLGNGTFYLAGPLTIRIRAVANVARSVSGGSGTIINIP